ncbi:uncharacterized protein Z518_03968 [Rhinocladiella mackenziei CBS 650.93]|uniref:Ankyrin repeat protein n=1 Tax=Rhinocladiella mackenziei CBS 650.93 TaxID=1442369 RepID=A0A0D2IJX9_9EURO|nr:uncharacterized protein Z518_03968 [Rhinocladiella mackenziei CBS 650.93]KIX05994.1 hypothetical protein Z518_03968 [Rhinocladiella mackenziei CBS 650.93]
MADSLCFRDAFLRTQSAAPEVTTPRITQEEYLRHLVRHMCSVRHPSDSKRDHFVFQFEPVGNCLRELALNDDYEPLNEAEAQQYHQLLVAALHGDLETVTSTFDAVRQLRAPNLDPLQPVAAVGARAGHMSIVNFALSRGAKRNRRQRSQ